MNKWSEQKVNEWYKDKGWVVGFNYVPSTAVNSTEMWQKESFDLKTIEKELALAAQTGYNSCRIFLQYIVWENERKEFFECFNKFLGAAEKKNITVMPILFDDCAFANKEPYLGKQDEPLEGVHNSGWTPSPGFKIADNPEYEAKLKEYVHDIISQYKDDKRIIVWDLYNEAGNSNRREKCIPLLEKAFIWAREVEPSQPLTACVWAWQDYDFEFINYCDVISYHSYSNYEQSLKHINILKKNNRPLFCTEWLHRPNGNRIETHMPLYKRENIGIYNWGLVKGKTQTNLNWDTMHGNPNPYPDEWQHDIFDTDYIPYDLKEVDFIKEITK